MANNIYREKGWLYLWHKDNDASYNSNDIDCGAMVYISIYEDLECDGYNGTVGKADDFREKLYVEYEMDFNKTELFDFKNDDGEWDSCEACWARIVRILDVNEELDKMVVHDIDLSEDEYEMLLEDEELCEEFFEELSELF